MSLQRPGKGLKTEKMPGHWVLARLGKRVLHHGVRPLTIAEWRLLLKSEGFEIKATDTASMNLLEPARLVRDEGLRGAMRFALNVLRDTEARRSVLEMRRTFRRNRELIAAVAIPAVKK